MSWEIPMVLTLPLLIWGSAEATLSKIRLICPAFIWLKVVMIARGKFTTIPA